MFDIKINSHVPNNDGLPGPIRLTITFSTRSAQYCDLVTTGRRITLDFPDGDKNIAVSGRVTHVQTNYEWLGARYDVTFQQDGAPVITTLPSVYKYTLKNVYADGSEHIIPAFHDGSKIAQDITRHIADTMMANVKHGGVSSNAITGVAPDRIIIDDPHPNCRCASLVIKEKKPMKVRNKFYVAADKVTTRFEQDADNTGPVRPTPNGRWTKKTLADAVAHAERLLESEPNREHVAVVQIVRVVRRKKLPFVVETVK